MLRKITFKGNPLTLVGRKIKIGDPAPDFKVVLQDLTVLGISAFSSKIKVLTSFPSLDTPVCDLQVKEFNRKALNASKDVMVVGISKDLPFAQKRFCLAHDINNIVIVSDYRTSSFGINYGLLIKELNLLARSILIVDQDNIVRYIQVVEELTNAPDYEDAIKNLELVRKNPKLADNKNVLSRCRPCEGRAAALSKQNAEGLLGKIDGWQLVEDKKIVKEFIFKDFIEAKYFLDLVSVVAEEQAHHPTLTLIYNKLKVTLTTHAVGGLSENDFIMARMIDELCA
ncbi:MAG: thiol peroxidase [Candidatus Omnitrophica bacterium]|nr:thiol peroxidase [Candidatus Omnitrophota bacterium]